MWIQLPLMEDDKKLSTVQRKTWFEDNPLPSQALDFAYDHNWLGWFGVLWLGLWDAKICPPGYRLTKISLSTAGNRHMVTLVAYRTGEPTLVSFHLEQSRHTLVRGFRQAARSKSLKWKESKW